MTDDTKVEIYTETLSFDEAVQLMTMDVWHMISNDRQSNGWAKCCDAPIRPEEMVDWPYETCKICVPCEKCMPVYSSLARVLLHVYNAGRESVLRLTSHPRGHFPRKLQ